MRLRIDVIVYNAFGPETLLPEFGIFRKRRTLRQATMEESMSPPLFTKLSDTFLNKDEVVKVIKQM